MDQPGQPYSLLIAGHVFLAEANPPAGPTNYPQSSVSFDAARYSCAANAVLKIFDTSGTATAALVKANTTFQVRNAAGAVIDSETNFDFTAGAVAGQFNATNIPIRLAAPAVTGDGILEADTDHTVVATYNRAPQRAITARAAVRCSPDLVNASFIINNGTTFGPQNLAGGGCDFDENLDAGEVMTYGIALNNRNLADAYPDLIATLTPSGPGAAAIRVIDSPKNLGTLPAGLTNGLFFHLQVDAAAANALSVANRVVTLTLNLESLARGVRITRQSYSFLHAINSDRDELYYSTDYPAGGREVRDINRNLEIDPVDTVDPFLGFIVPDEDVTFATLFSGSGGPGGVPTNILGEDLDNDLTVDATERDILPNGVQDRGILALAGGPSAGDRVPWNFDSNSGGWVPFRHAGSIPADLSPTPLWEYKTSGGLCGFQSAGGADKFGIWHTGDANPTTPDAVATACDLHSQPGDQDTASKVELIFDILESPIVAKVNQLNDARGFPYTVEFQRFAFNENIQTVDGYAGGGVNIDNDVDSDNANSLLGQTVDTYYTRRSGGWPYVLMRDTGGYFDLQGIDPLSANPFQRTFGPFQNPTPGGGFSGDESGFSGTTPPLTNANSTSPIPEANPDFLPFPLPGAPSVGTCDGGTQNNDTCDPLNGSDPCITGGGVCTAGINSVAGPVRNFDITLVGYEGGQGSVIDPAPVENFFFFQPGRAGNRWQIGIGFWAIESTTGDTDFGKAIDDPVFEWKEYHPGDEAALGHAPACARFGGSGQAAGGQCATLTTDRVNLYECDEEIEVTVFDAKCRSIGAGNTSTLGGACTTHAQCGSGGVCSAAFASVQVQVVTDTDSIPVAAAGGQVRYPNSKLYTLNAVAGSPGLYRGNVIISTTTNDAFHAFTVPGTDGVFSIYYHDPLCDGDVDGQAAEDDFNNVDGDRRRRRRRYLRAALQPGAGGRGRRRHRQCLRQLPEPLQRRPGRRQRRRRR